jgi:hypothetical protein
MKAICVHGMAVFALFVTVPRANAWVIYQTFTYSQDDHTGQQGALGGLTPWFFNQFSPAWGQLQTAAISFTSAGHVSETDSNPFSNPIGVSADYNLLTAWNNFAIMPTLFVDSPHTSYTQRPGDPLALATFAAYTWGFDFKVTSTAGPALDLGAFIGTGQRRLDLGVFSGAANDILSNHTLQHTSTVTVRYEYAGAAIPDTGNSAVLLCCALLPFLVHRLKMRRTVGV